MGEDNGKTVMTKEDYMRLALDIARKGRGRTSPNPMVGCVVVRNQRIVAEGYHERYGGFHAERNALTRCTEDLTGAEMYVTLEPCCHYGNTPPCTEIIIERGISKVYVGCMDANPQVAGKGVQILREHGIAVETGILEEECLALNEIFFHYITTKMPFVAMKYAMTMDCKIASHTGDSKWVTGAEARHHVHELRRQYSAIMVGIGTVLADDPLLNCRIEEGVDPLRIICDSKLRTPLDSQIVKTAKDIPTMICYDEGQKEKVDALRAAGVELLCAGSQGRVDIQAVIRELASRSIDSVLVEGGGIFHGAVLQSGLVNKIYCYMAPKLIGGKHAKSPVEGGGFSLMREALAVSDIEIIKLGKDICISGRVGRISSAGENAAAEKR